MDGTNVSGKYDSAHMDLLGEMDKTVGSIIEHLEKRGVLDETIIVFTSDNGGLGNKATGNNQFGHYPSGPLKGRFVEQISISMLFFNTHSIIHLIY